MITAKIVTEPFEAQIGNDFKIIAKTITDSEGNSLNLDTSFFEIEWKDTGGIAYLMRHDPNGENLNCKVEDGILQMIFDRTKYRFRYPEVLSYRIHTRSYDSDMFDGAFDIWTLPQKSNIRLTVGGSLFGCKKILSHMEMPFNYQKGDKGDQGEKGDTGLKGETGEKGIQGVQGVQGERGERGEKGEKGEKGNTGSSSYELAKSGGYKGTEAQFSEEQASIANNGVRLTALEKDKPSAGRTFLTPLFVARGAVFNDKTGYYELNGLTDLTEQQMINIYNYTSQTPSNGNWKYMFWTNDKMRTNFPPKSLMDIVDMNSSFSQTNFEVIILNIPTYINRSISVKDFYAAFTLCNSLRKIIGVLNLSAITKNMEGLHRSPLLEEVKIQELKISLSLGQSSNLTKESILYLINNAGNTTPITLTLHPTATTRLTPEEIALASSKNITIA